MYSLQELAMRPFVNIVKNHIKMGKVQVCFPKIVDDKTRDMFNTMNVPKIIKN